MKALLITKNESKFTNLKSGFIKNFVGLKLEINHTNDSSMESISENDKDYTFFVIDAGFGKELDQTLNTVIDISAKRPIVICGSKAELENINKSLIIKNENTMLLRDYESVDKIKSIIELANNWSKETETHLNSKAEEEEGVINDNDLSNFLTFKVRNLHLYDKFPHNLYMKVSEKKLMIGIEKNTEIRQSQITLFNQRKIKDLYIDKDRHIVFLESSLKNAKTFLLKNKNFNKKLIMAHLRSIALIHDYLLNVGVTEKISIFLEIMLENIIQSLDRENHFLSVAEHYTFNIESVLSKGLITAYTSFFILKEMNWKSATIRKKFLLAAILQDTYLQNDQLSTLKNLKDPKIINFSEEEIRLFPEHPKLIAELARQLTKYPDVDYLLEQHHELPTRDGFPKRSSPSELQVAVCLFNIASNFAREIDGKTMNEENIKETFKKFEKEFNVGNFKQPLQCLKKILTDRL